MDFLLLKGIPYYPLIRLDESNNIMPQPSTTIDLPPRHKLIDIKSDPIVVKEMTKYFTEKIMGWLNKDLKLQKSKKDKLLKKIKNEYFVIKCLESFVRETNGDWYHLYDNEKIVKLYIIKTIKKEI